MRLLGRSLSGCRCSAWAAPTRQGHQLCDCWGPDCFSALSELLYLSCFQRAGSTQLHEACCLSCLDRPPVHCAGTMPPCGYATPVRVLVDSGFVAASSSQVPVGCTKNKNEEGLQQVTPSPDAPAGPSGPPATSLQLGDSADKAAGDAVLFCGAGTPLAVLALTPQQLLRVSGGSAAPVAQGNAEAAGALLLPLMTLLFATSLCAAGLCVKFAGSSSTCLSCTEQMSRWPPLGRPAEAEKLTQRAA